MSETGAVQCPTCGRANAESSRFCGTCGRELTSPVNLFTDPNALRQAGRADSPPAASGYGASLGDTPAYSASSTGQVPGPEQTLYRGESAFGMSGPVVVAAAPRPPASDRGLKIAACIIGALLLVSAAVLGTVLVKGSTPPPTTVAAPAPSSTTTTTSTTTSTTSTTVVIAPVAAAPTSNPRLLGNDLGPSHAWELAAIQRFYEAVVRADWDYTRAHFINAENRGPGDSDAWWRSQYGTLREYWLAPVRVTDGTIWMGLVTHETDANGGPYSYQFCIPFSVAVNDFVRQAGNAVPRFTNKTSGSWIDPQQGIASLMSC